MRYARVFPIAAMAASMLGSCNAGPENDVSGGIDRDEVVAENRSVTHNKPPPDQDVCDRECLAQKEEEAEERRKYLAAKYPRERGQAFQSAKTINAAILDIYETARRVDFQAEYITVVYAGKYGETYYFEPKLGKEVTNPDGTTWWDTRVYREDYPPRPETSGVLVSIHNHLRGQGPESPIDNVKNLIPAFVVLSDGSIWLYPAKSAKAKPYGKIEKGHIKTAYNDLHDAFRPDYDVYAAGPASTCGFWCHFWSGVVTVGKVLITVGTLGAITFGASVSGPASTTGQECCPGPPESGYDPAADPLQVCRRPNGDDCR